MVRLYGAWLSTRRFRQFVLFDSNHANDQLLTVEEVHTYTKVNEERQHDGQKVSIKLWMRWLKIRFRLRK